MPWILHEEEPHSKELRDALKASVALCRRDYDKFNELRQALETASSKRIPDQIKVIHFAIKNLRFFKERKELTPDKVLQISNQFQFDQLPPHELVFLPEES